MPVAPVNVLLISPGWRDEFVQPLTELRRLAEVIECRTPSGAAEFLRQVDAPPVLVVIAQSRPGEYDPAELDQLVHLAPLARFVLLLGSWCEGETRTGHVWPGATRVFWYDWHGEVVRNLPAISAGRNAPWLAPVTTLEEERYLFEHGGSFVKPIHSASSQAGIAHGSQSLVLVCTRRSSYGEALCVACRQQGYEAHWQRPDRPEKPQGVTTILWEGIQLLPAELAELEALAANWPNTPIIALADFPRLETRERAVAAGAVAVLAKPCSLVDLAAHLQRWAPLPLSAVKTATEVA